MFKRHKQEHKKIVQKTRKNVIIIFMLQLTSVEIFKYEIRKNVMLMSQMTLTMIDLTSLGGSRKKSFLNF